MESTATLARVWRGTQEGTVKPVNCFRLNYKAKDYVLKLSSPCRQKINNDDDGDDNNHYKVSTLVLKQLRKVLRRNENAMIN